MDIWKFFSPWFSPFLTFCGVIAAWIPFFSKKPDLSLYLSVDNAPIHEGGYIDSRFGKQMLYLNLKMENCGDAAAENISVSMVKYFFDGNSGKLASQKEQLEKISGDLLPKEIISFLFPIKASDTNHPFNHIKVALYYEKPIICCWRKKFIRKTTWFFNVVNNKRIANDLHRVDKVNHIPVDLWPAN